MPDDLTGSAGAGNPGDGAGAGNLGAAGDVGGGGQASVDFSTFIPADIKEHPSLKTHDFKTPEGIGKMLRSYVAAQSMVGGDKIVLPKGANDNPENWGKVYDALGRPKDPAGYQFGKDRQPTTDPAAKAVEDKFRSFAHAQGFTQKQFAELDGFLNTLVSESRTQMVNGYKAKHEKAVEALKKEWGNEYDARINTANKVLTTFGGQPEEIKAFLSLYKNEPVVIRILAEIGKRIDESALVSGGKSDLGLGPADAKSKRADIMTNKDNPLHEAWKNKRHPRHKEAMDEVARLSKIAVGKDEVIYE